MVEGSLAVRSRGWKALLLGPPAKMKVPGTRAREEESMLRLGSSKTEGRIGAVSVARRCLVAGQGPTLRAVGGKSG